MQHALNHGYLVARYRLVAAINGSLDPTPGKGNFRYRVYETVVPLRNAVWNIHNAS